jgi:hypothetical protein
MNKKMFGISAIAMLLAVMLIAAPKAGTSDLFAKKYGQGNEQSAFIRNDCISDIEDKPSDLTSEPTANDNGNVAGGGGMPGPDTDELGNSLDQPISQGIDDRAFTTTSCSADILQNQDTDGAALCLCTP